MTMKNEALAWSGSTMKIEDPKLKVMLRAYLTLGNALLRERGLEARYALLQEMSEAETQITHRLMDLAEGIEPLQVERPKRRSRPGKS